LTETFCIETKKAAYYGDGGGLYLIVKPDGRKYWCYRWRDRQARYTTGKSAGVGKLREKGLGRFGEHDVSLKQARELAGDCRYLVKQGKDPIADGRWQPTFHECALRYINQQKSRWSNEKHARQWISTLNTHAAQLMPVHVDDIDTQLVLSCLEPIWTGKTETATRVRQRIESVLDWAIVRKYRNSDNPARWRGNLNKHLPRPAKLNRPVERACLDYRRVGEFMERLRTVDSLAARALELQILTATSPGDVVTARWSEFGLVGEVWIIPARRTSTSCEHTVPLSQPALQLLKNLPQVSEYVFPGRATAKCMTTAAGMKLLKNLQPGITQQGFRATFRDWAADQADYPREVISHAMGPKSRDDAEAAYFRSDLIAQRARMMRDWAEYCQTTEALTRGQQP